MSNNNSKKIIKTVAVILSVVLLFTAVAIYGIFKNETDIDANITQKYLDDNGIKITEFYGTSRFTEIESAIQAQRNSYWKTRYILPIVFGCLSLLAAAAAYIISKKNKKSILDAIDTFVVGFGGLFMFIFSLIRFVTADFSHLYYTSESGFWLGVGSFGWFLAVISLVAAVAVFFLSSKDISLGEKKKAAGSDIDKDVFIPVDLPEPEEDTTEDTEEDTEDEVQQDEEITGDDTDDNE